MLFHFLWKYIASEIPSEKFRDFVSNSFKDFSENFIRDSTRNSFQVYLYGFTFRISSRSSGVPYEVHLAIPPKICFAISLGAPSGMSPRVCCVVSSEVPSVILPRDFPGIPSGTPSGVPSRIPPRVHSGTPSRSPFRDLFRFSRVYYGVYCGMSPC